MPRRVFARPGKPQRMRLMNYNILSGGTGRIDPLAEIIRQADADVVILPEACDTELLALLARRLGMEYFAACNPTTPAFAVGVLSRLPLRSAVNLSAMVPELSKSGVLVQVAVGGKIWQIVGVHLHHYETPEDEARRLREWTALQPYLASLPDTTGPVLLAGDFNTNHPAQPFDPALLRPKAQARIAPYGKRIPTELVTQILAAGWVDAYAEGKPPAEWQASFTTRHPGQRVDYIFLPPTLKSHLVRSWHHTDGLAKFASDHFPVIAELRV